MNSPKLFTCIGVDFDGELVSHFVDHFESRGVYRNDFHVLVHSTHRESKNRARVFSLLRDRGIRRTFDWIGDYTSREMWDRRRQLQVEYAKASDWVINADVDELHDYPDSLESIIRFCERRQVRVVQGVLIDRVTVDGQLAAVAEQQSLWEQYPVACDLMCSVAGTGHHHDHRGSVKLMLHRGDQLPTIGGHGVLKPPPDLSFLAGQPLDRFPRIGDANFRFRYPFHVHHFKWTSSVIPSMKRRLATPGFTAAGKEYGEKILRFVDEKPSIDIGPLPKMASNYPRDKARPWKRQLQFLRIAPNTRNLARKLKRAVGRVSTRPSLGSARS